MHITDCSLDLAAPSMFGRDLTEQIFADKLPVPAIVTKCIAAVEVVGELESSLCALGVAH